MKLAVNEESKWSSRRFVLGEWQEGCRCCKVGVGWAKIHQHSLFEELIILSHNLHRNVSNVLAQYRQPKAKINFSQLPAPSTQLWDNFLITQTRMPETNLLVTCLNLLIQQFKLPSSGIGKDFSGHISEHKNHYCLFPLSATITSN